MPLRMPDHFAQAFAERVQRFVLVAARGAQPLEMRTHAGRLVDRELLGDGEVQRQVQERIDATGFRRIVAVEIPLRIVERRRGTRDAARPGSRRSFRDR